MSDEATFEARFKRELAQVRDTKESIKSVAKLALAKPDRLAASFHVIADLMPQVSHAAAARHAPQGCARCRPFFFFFFSFFFADVCCATDPDQGADGAAVRVRRHLPARQAGQGGLHARGWRVRSSK